MPIAVNPIGKIPTLVMDDGQVLFDSRVIAGFLNDHFDLGLYPESALYKVLTLEATGDGICDAAVLMVYEKRTRPEELWYAPFVEGQWAKITRALDHLEAGSLDRLSGPLTIGHFSVAAALGYLDFRHGDRDWRGARPALADWFTGFSARPSMVATTPTA